MEIVSERMGRMGIEIKEVLDVEEEDVVEEDVELEVEVAIDS